MSEVRYEASRDVREGTGKPPDSVNLDLLPGNSLDAVGRLVAAGVAARLGLDVHRIEDLQFALDAAMHQSVPGDQLRLALAPTKDDLQVRLGPFALTSTEWDGLERVLSALVDEVEINEAGPEAWITMRISRRPLARAGR